MEYRYTHMRSLARDRGLLTAPVDVAAFGVSPIPLHFHTTSFTGLARSMPRPSMRYPVLWRVCS